MIRAGDSNGEVRCVLDNGAGRVTGGGLYGSLPAGGILSGATGGSGG